jgi:hypothetical protein
MWGMSAKWKQRILKDALQRCGEIESGFVALVDKALQDRSTNAYESLANIILYIREHDKSTKYASLCHRVGRMTANKCPAAGILKYIVEHYP